MALPIFAVAVGALTSVFTWLFVRIITLLGLSFVTFYGVKPLLNNVVNMIKNLLNIQTPTFFPLVEWLGVMKFDICVSIIISAVLTKLVVSGLSGGSFKKVAMK